MGVYIREVDEELVEQARAGDLEAFGTLVKRHQGPVIGFLVAMFHDLDLAEESAQQAFVRAFQSLGSFEGRSEFRTWVARIAVNAARSQLRWVAVRRWISGSADGERQAQTSIEDLLRGPDELALLEKRLELERAMAGLSAREREIVALRLEGYSLVEIAGVLEISEGTVKSTLFCATQKIRRKWK